MGVQVYRPGERVQILVGRLTGNWLLRNKRRLYQARLLGLDTFDTITEVLAYEALPNILDGIRTAVSYALMLVNAVEMFIGLSERGLGRSIYEYQSTYRIPKTYGAVIIAGIIGILLNAVVSQMERRMLRWLPNVQED
jgi:ABC-type nitrate/sulfonate/bicarbonate transport system permease component